MIDYFHFTPLVLIGKIIFFFLKLEARLEAVIFSYSLKLISKINSGKAQSSSELKSMAANKSLCPKMFEQWTIDRSTVGVKDIF